MTNKEQKELAHAISLIFKFYEEAKSKEWVNRPICWAVYQAWKEMDSNPHKETRIDE